MAKSKFDYLIKLTYDPEYKGYVAEVINLYGCMSQGKTKAEALKNAEKAIIAYMEALAKTKEKGAKFEVKRILTPIPAVNA